MRQVTTGIPQGSLLGPICFIIFINDLPDEVNNISSLFADHTKIYFAVNNKTDQENLQLDLLKLDQWSITSQLTFNQAKCKHIHIGKKTTDNYQIMDRKTSTKQMEDDMGIFMNNRVGLLFRDPVDIKINKANRSHSLGHFLSYCPDFSKF